MSSGRGGRSRTDHWEPDDRRNGDVSCLLPLVLQSILTFGYSSAGSVRAVEHVPGLRGVVQLRLVTAGIHAVRALAVVVGRPRTPAVVTAVTASQLIRSLVPLVGP